MYLDIIGFSDYQYCTLSNSVLSNKSRVPRVLKANPTIRLTSDIGLPITFTLSSLKKYIDKTAIPEEKNPSFINNKHINYGFIITARKTNEESFRIIGTSVVHAKMKAKELAERGYTEVSIYKLSSKLETVSNYKFVKSA